MTDTLRAHLEAIVAERDRAQSGDIFEAYVLTMRRVTAHADDALAILEDAEWALDGWQHERIPYRLVADPPQSGGTICT